MENKKLMKGLVCHKDGSVSLDDVPIPQIMDKRDVLVRVTLSAICTSNPVCNLHE